MSFLSIENLSVKNFNFKPKITIMIKILLALSLFLFSLMTLIAQVPYDNFKIYYPFNGNSVNEIDSTYNLLNDGANICNDRFGIPASAYCFNGMSGLKAVNCIVNNQSLPQSVSLWFQTDDLNNVAFTGMLFGYVGSNSATSRFHVGIKNGQIVTDYGNGATGNYKVGRSPLKYNDSKWHQVVFVSQGDAQPSILYVDGDSIMQIDGGINNNNKIVDIKVGGDKTQNYFTGKIDDIRVYTKSLNAREVKFLYYESPCIKQVTIYDTIRVVVIDTIFVNDTIAADSTIIPTDSIANKESLTTKLTSQKSSQHIIVYPNPTNGKITIKINEFIQEDEYIIVVTKINGEKVFSIITRQPETTLNMSQFGGKGAFIIKIMRNNKELETQKLLSY
jgi:hypothetical protein